MNEQDSSPQHSKIPIRHGFLILSAFQLFALVFCAFVIGAIVPLFVQFQKQQSPKAPNGIIAPFTSRQVFKNFLRQSNRTIDNEKRLAWLMSFPNSGSKFTLDIVSDVSDTRTASNYVQIQNESAVSVFANTNGPFWMSSTKPVPSQTVLTQTFCGGYCHTCKSLQSMETPHSFLMHCATSEVDVTDATGGSVIKRETYSYNLVDRAVHLIRNPFDVIASRFLTDRDYMISKNATLNRLYTPDIPGFKAFCTDISKVHDENHDSHVDPEALQLVIDIPCHFDLFRIIQWHNAAIITTSTFLYLPTHVLYFEDFSKEETLTSLLNFLDLQKHRPPSVPKFDRSRSHHHFFTQDQVERMSTAAMALASPQAWTLLERYFEA